jgi:class 3 adenylate cyclase
VHEAARIGSLAGAEEIIASLATVEAAGLQAADSREVALKGIKKPVSVVPINWC